VINISWKPCDVITGSQLFNKNTKYTQAKTFSNPTAVYSSILIPKKLFKHPHDLLLTKMNTTVCTSMSAAYAIHSKNKIRKNTTYSQKVSSGVVAERRGNNYARGAIPLVFILWKFFLVGNFNPKMQNLGWRKPHFGNFKDKIKILNTRNLIRRKFAVAVAKCSFRPSWLFQPPTTPLNVGDNWTALWLELIECS